jgi:hypothetical protein
MQIIKGKALSGLYANLGGINKDRGKTVSGLS